MKIIFAGTPEFAAVALSAILDAAIPVPLVLTQPDRPGGRGMNLQPSPVKVLAQSRGIEVFQPVTLRDPIAQARIAAVAADVMVVAAYGLILPQAVLDLPRRGCLNIHASLLPRWRGAAPIQRALLAGDAQTGICIMRMEAGLDTGPLLLTEATAIGDADHAGSVHDRLAGIGGRLVVRALRELDSLTPVAQSAEGVTYAHKIDKSEAPLDFTRPATQLVRQIRAFDPFPGASATLAGDTFKFWSGQAESIGGGVPGEILDLDRSGVLIACGEGALRVVELQKSGGKRLSTAQFLAGCRWQVGMCFSLPVPAST